MEIINELSGKKTIKDVQCGDNVSIRDFVNLYGCIIGDESKVGTFVEIQNGATIGKRCKIQSHTFICGGVHIGDGVFVGHNVSFINDVNPRAIDDEGNMITDQWVLEETLVEDGAAIGTSATIMAGVRIGKYATVGAGAMVIHDVPDYATVVGNPARIISKQGGRQNR